jgi:chromosome segregation ATPase
MMADETTDELNGKRPFEERVFARFDVLDSRFNSIDRRFDMVDSAVLNLDSRLESVESRLEKLEVRADDTNSRLEKLEVRADETNSRLQKLEIRAYDTKPIWEQALKEIVDMKRDLSKRFSRIEAAVLEIRADLIEVEDRVEKDVEPRLQKLERKLIQ